MCCAGVRKRVWGLIFRRNLAFEPSFSLHAFLLGRGKRKVDRKKKERRKMRVKGRREEVRDGDWVEDEEEKGMREMPLWLARVCNYKGVDR